MLAPQAILAPRPGSTNPTGLRIRISTSPRARSFSTLVAIRRASPPRGERHRRVRSHQRGTSGGIQRPCLDYISCETVLNAGPPIISEAPDSPHRQRAPLRQDPFHCSDPSWVDRNRADRQSAGAIRSDEEDSAILDESGTWRSKHCEAHDSRMVVRNQSAHGLANRLACGEQVRLAVTELAA